MSRVTMNKDGVFIDGSAAVILCGSLFYYRIPHELWEDRLYKIKTAGYNCIDVYFPWNFHETEPGQWNFSDDHDAALFLKLAKKHDLFVIARPGPYICGEWDGGGLPAYLYTDSRMKVRQNDELYLSYVKSWYDHIIPIIADFQADNGGTVLAVQVENELDFFPCADPKGYIGALRDYVRTLGISVPVIGCVGNFNIEKATGYADGVVPTMNIYPDSDNPKFEDHSAEAYKYMYAHDFPLLVTETNRSHDMLRRLMLNGAKLLGPFNQVGGTCFGFTNAINNWGRPLSFLSSDYNFGGIINGQGEVNRGFYGARLLSKFINLFNDDLGRATLEEKTIGFIGNQTVESHPYMLRFGSGGYLTTVTNYKEEPEQVKVKIDDEVYPVFCDITAERLKAPFLLYNYDLKSFGLEGKIRFSSLELAHLIKKDNRFTFLVYTNHSGEIILELPQLKSVDFSGMYENKNRLIIDMKPGERCTIHLQNEVIELVCLSELDAALAEGIENGQVTFIRDLHVESTPFKQEFSLTQKELNLKDWLKPNQIPAKEPKQLEEYQIYRGFGNYRFTFVKGTSVKGLLLNEASDVASVYLNENFIDGAVLCNNNHFIPIENETLTETNQVTVVTEIWGHTNFHDSKLPSLYMDSLKGLKNLYVIQEMNDVTVQTVDENTRILKFTVKNSEQNAFFLELELNEPCALTVNGQEAGMFNAFNSTALLTGLIKTGNNEAVLKSKRELTDIKGRLLIGNAASFEGLNALGETELSRLVAGKKTETAKLPYAVSSGSRQILNLAFDNPEHKCIYTLVAGENIKLTAFYNGRLTSRIYLNSKNTVMVGGRANLIYLPQSFSQAQDNHLTLLAEAPDKDNEAVLKTLEFFQVN